MSFIKNHLKFISFTTILCFFISFFLVLICKCSASASSYSCGYLYSGSFIEGSYDSELDSQISFTYSDEDVLPVTFYSVLHNSRIVYSSYSATADEFGHYGIALPKGTIESDNLDYYLVVKVSPSFKMYGFTFSWLLDQDTSKRYNGFYAPFNASSWWNPASLAFEFYQNFISTDLISLGSIFPLSDNAAEINFTPAYRLTTSSFCYDPFISSYSGYLCYRFSTSGKYMDNTSLIINPVFCSDYYLHSTSDDAFNYGLNVYQHKPLYAHNTSSLSSYFDDITLSWGTASNLQFRLGDYPQSFSSDTVDLNYFYDNFTYLQQLRSSVFTVSFPLTSLVYSPTLFQFKLIDGRYFYDNDYFSVDFGIGEGGIRPDLVLISGSSSNVGLWRISPPYTGNSYIQSFSFDNSFYDGGYYLDSFTLINSSYNDGYNNGFAAGSDQGYNNGFAAGSDQGYNNGFAAGSDQGYNNGYYEGVKNSDGKPFNTLVLSLIEVPFVFLKNTLSWDLFGINFYNLIFGLISIGVVTWIIKKFL